MTFCFDLDGTLCTTVGMDYMGATPIRERIERVNRLHAKGHTIVIDTARGSGNGFDWTERTRQQLDAWGVKYDRLRCGEKIPADVYVDDRSQWSEVWDTNTKK